MGPGWRKRVEATRHEVTTVAMTKLFQQVDKVGAVPLRPRFSTLGAGATVGMRWRFRRNLVIYVAFKNGFSQRVLSDVFDLPRSRIGTIIKEISVIEESQ